ncbi:trigger factor [Mycobacterium lepromatosis]|uniref:Trigger factor n=1 Tax=Mycobacterium lepromatosis TaxID=480418 RepID=A0A0F4ER84_9MYCO|nr:trigger factor [Mycobacterium lepromatosis]KJX75102.1 trigger factor [Mycobacterium lepromatosis]UKN42585.1 trigger factor [Mycobacterium lepromatosis]
MKSSVEQLNPTRVRINVEVPFTELEPDFQRAYKELARHVRLPGFRPGKVPARLLEARFGRETLLDQVVNEAMPSRYGQALAESEVQPIGQPEIEVTRKEYGQDLAFTVEVEVRPKIALPDFSTLTVVVDPVEVSTDDVEEELQSLRARFGTLTGVDRPVALGDFVSIDLSTTINGEKVPNVDAEGLSHEVGSGRFIAGLDDALVGLSVGESRVFTTQLVTGEHAGRDAEVIVTVKSVKERELPEPDDEFAQLASEFDTMTELRADLGDQIRQAKHAQQAEKIGDAAVNALLERVDVPLPEGIVQAQFDSVLHAALSGVGHDETKFAEVLAERGSSREEFEAETRSTAEKDVTRQLLLDVVAEEQKIQVGQDDLNERLLATSRQYGVDAQQLFGFLRENSQLSSLVIDMRRRLAVAAVVEAATVTDVDGNTIDTSEFFGKHAQRDQVDQKTEEADPTAVPSMTKAVE